MAEPTTQVPGTAPVTEAPAPETAEQQEVTWAQLRTSKAGQELFSKLKILEDAQSAQKQAESEREQTDALKRGEHEQVIAKLKAEQQSIVAEHEVYKRTSALENRLAREGALNPVFVRGAIAGLGDADIDQYVESLKKDNAEWFDPAKQAVQPPTGANPTPSSGRTNWASVRQQLQSRNPQERTSARQQLEAYIRANGTPPPER